MKTSELIIQLREAIETYGDLDVLISDDCLQRDPEIQTAGKDFDIRTEVIVL